MTHSWTARHSGTCPACKEPITERVDEVEWPADTTVEKVIHARPACRAKYRPAKVCPVHGLTLPATGICDDCS